MFQERHPTCSASYETYRKIFNTKLNTSFGFPRDSCSTCYNFSLTCQALDLDAQLTHATDEKERVDVQNNKERED